MELISALLAVATIFLAAISGLLGIIYRDMIREIMPKLQTINQALFGRDADETDDGLVSDIKELDTKLERLEDAREREHAEVQEDIQELRGNLRRFAQAMRESEAVDIEVSVGNNNGQHDYGRN